MSTRIEREYKAMLAPDRLAFVRNREGGVCQVRILRELSDRYVVGYPDPAINGRKLQALMKDEWEIADESDWTLLPFTLIGGLLVLIAIIGCIISLLSGR